MIASQFRPATDDQIRVAVAAYRKQSREVKLGHGHILSSAYARGELAGFEHALGLLGRYDLLEEP